MAAVKGSGKTRGAKFTKLPSPDCEHDYPPNKYVVSRKHMHHQCVVCKGWLNIRRPFA